MSERERQRRTIQRRGSFSIREWCEYRRISPAMFYKLDQMGLAPRSYYVGKKRCISDQADANWLRDREAEQNAAA